LTLLCRKYLFPPAKRHNGALPIFMFSRRRLQQSGACPPVPNIPNSHRLHSCGSLTDLILEQCFRWQASFSLVPCCYGRVQNERSRPLCQLYASVESGAFKAILSAADYTVRAGQWDFLQEPNYQVCHIATH